jgi:hypothetical protein
MWPEFIGADIRYNIWVWIPVYVACYAGVHTFVSCIAACSDMIVSNLLIREVRVTQMFLYLC